VVRVVAERTAQLGDSLIHRPLGDDYPSPDFIEELLELDRPACVPGKT
jgi:hypothetical protein